MATDEAYDKLLKNTKLFNEKEFIDLDEKDVEDYLSYLGFPKLPSEIFKNTVQGKNVLFLLLCKLFQDYNNLGNKKDNTKKDLDCHHVKLFVYLMLNLENRGIFSVYNSLVIKIMNIEIPSSEVVIYYYKANLESRLKLTSSLYFESNGSRMVVGGNQLVFSDNELNDLISVLNKYMYIFQYFYKMLDKYNKKEKEDKERRNEKEKNEIQHVKMMLIIILKQILLLFRIIRYYDKQYNKKSINNLLVFVYYFNKYRTFLNNKKNNTNNKEDKENKNNKDKELKETLLLIDKLNDEVLRVAQNPVKDSLLELLDMSGDGNKNKDKDNKESKENNRERDKNNNKESRFGLLLVLHKAVELVRDDVIVVERVLNKLMVFIKMFNKKEKQNMDKENKGYEEEDNKEKERDDELICVESYYRVLSSIGDGNLLLSYNSNSSVLSLVNKVLEFVFDQMYQKYSYKFNDSDNKENRNKKKMKCLWDVLVIISNLNLEFVDEKIEKVFEMLKMDFEEFSNEKLKNKSLGIMYNVCNEKENKTSSNKDKENNKEENNKEDDLGGCDILPSCNFINNLIIQYNDTNQLGVFFEYVQKYYYKFNDSDNKEKENKEKQNMDEENKDNKKRVLGGILDVRKAKKMKFQLESESKFVDNNTKEKKENKERSNEKEDRNKENNNKDRSNEKKDEYEMNYLNNYCVMRSINELEVNENEVIRILKTFEKFDKGIYSLIVVYLNKLRFSVKNLDKVTEQFLKLYSSFQFKNEVEVQVGVEVEVEVGVEVVVVVGSLMVMYQVLVGVRKLLSFFNPFYKSDEETLEEDSTTCNEEDDNESKGKQNRGRYKEDKYERDKKLRNKLMEVVNDIYLYLNRNIDKESLKNKKNNIVVLNMLYHLMMINNENKERRNEKENKKEGRNEEYLDVNKMVIKLLNSNKKEDKDNKEDLYRFLLRNNRLFLNNDEVDGFLLRGIDKGMGDMKMIVDKGLYNKLDGKLTLEYFKRNVLYIIKESFKNKKNSTNNKEDKDNNKDKENEEDNKEEEGIDSVRSLYMLLENIIEIDNSEVVKCLLENIDDVSRQMFMKRRNKEDKERKGKVIVSLMEMLLELLLYVLEYEMKIGVSNCYYMIVRYQQLYNNKKEDKENKEENNKEKNKEKKRDKDRSNEKEENERESTENKEGRGKMNLFDILISMKKMLVDDDNEEKENEQYEKEKKRIFKMFVKYYYLFSIYIYKKYNKNKNNKDNKQTKETNNKKDNKDNKENEEGNVVKMSYEQLNLINSLLYNYLEGLKFNKNTENKDNKEKEMKKWDVYFIYKYIRMLKLNGYEGVCRCIFQSNGILYDMIEWYFSLVNNKKEDNKENERENNNEEKENKNNYDKVVEMVYNNQNRIMDNKYISNLLLVYLNDVDNNNKDNKKENEDNEKEENKLYSIILRIIEVMNKENEYMLKLYNNEEKDELNMYFKKLFELNYDMYKNFVFSCIGDINKKEDKDNKEDWNNKERSNEKEDEHQGYEEDKNKYLLLMVVLINNYDNKKEENGDDNENENKDEERNKKKKREKENKTKEDDRSKEKQNNKEDKENEKDAELYNKLVGFVRYRQKYINKYVNDLSRCEGVVDYGHLDGVEDGVAGQVVGGCRVFDLDCELVLNYLMVNKLYNVDGNLGNKEKKDCVIGLAQIILCHLNRNDVKENKGTGNNKENKGVYKDIISNYNNYKDNNNMYNIEKENNNNVNNNKKERSNGVTVYDMEIDNKKEDKENKEENNKEETKHEEERNEDIVNRLLQILMKLVNMLVSNITQNMIVVVYFYIQFNHFVLNKRRYCNLKELIRFTNLIINSNNYKHVRRYLPILINVLIRTYYYLVHQQKQEISEVDLILMEEFGDEFNKSKLSLGSVKKLGSDREEKEDGNNEENDKENNKEKENKNLEWLKRNIIRYVTMCDSKVKTEIYNMMSDDKIKMLYKTELSRHWINH